MRHPGVTFNRDVLLDAVVKLPAERSCPCKDALAGIELPFELP